MHEQNRTAETTCGSFDKSCAKGFGMLHASYCVTTQERAVNKHSSMTQTSMWLQAVQVAPPTWLVLVELHRSVEGSTLSQSHKTKAGSLGASYRLTHILYVSLLRLLFRSRRISPINRCPDPLKKHSRAVCLHPGLTCAKRSAPMLRVPAVHAGQRYSPCRHTLIWPT